MTKIKQIKLHKTFESNLNSTMQYWEHFYVLADKRVLQIGDKLDFNLFTPNTPTSMSLFLQSHTVLDKVQQHKLRDIEQIYVLKKQNDKYNSFLEKYLQSILKDESISLDEKTSIIYASTRSLTKSLYENPNGLENLQHLEKIITPILENIVNNKNTIASYIKIIEYDYYTHTHCLNVSIYALSLGSKLGLDYKTLNALGSSALLHDLGKSKINYDITIKKKHLSNAEFEKMKKHTIYGYETALSIGIKDQDILDGIKHHHEKLDGSGYPDGLKDKEITLFARLIAVCDVFDALTTKRSYKEALSSVQALKIMKTSMYSHLDIKLVDTFIRMLI